MLVSLYPTLMGSKTPPQNAAKEKKLGGGSTAHKSPVGEGLIIRGDEENPHGLKFHFISVHIYQAESLSFFRKFIS